MQRIAGFSGILAVAILGALAPLAAAAPKATDLVQAELLANVKQIRAGQPFWLGVRLRILPQWHIYWINPGDAGQATSVTWNLPDGYTAGPLQFPTPQRFDDAGVVTFGYTDEVMLLAKVTPPEHFAASAPAQVKVSAKVNFLVCSDVCLPGQQTAELALPADLSPATVDGSENKANSAEFGKWLSQLPVAVKSKASPASSSISAPGTLPVRVTLDWHEAVQNVQAFPIVDSAIELKDVQLTTSGGKTQLIYSPDILQGMKPASTVVKWVFAYEDSAGRRRGVSLAAPMATP